MKPVKLAVSGKGGVGKTTVAALLCRAFADRRCRVLAVDADPDANLASALGFSEDCVFTPLAAKKELIEERTGASAGASGGFFKLNPDVSDLPDMLCREREGIRLMVMGSVKKGGGGCICPESAVLKALMAHLLVYRDEAVILDMEAGIEHLGRATAQSVDRLLIVVEPGRRSMETARTIAGLAADIGLHRISLVGNKIRSGQDREFILAEAGGLDCIGFLPFDEALIQADMSRRACWEAAPQHLAAAGQLVDRLTG